MRVLKLAVVHAIGVLAMLAPLSARSWKDLILQADSLASAYKLDSAVVLYESAREQTEAQFGGRDSATAVIFDRLGQCYLQGGAFSEADSLLHRALSIREQALGPDHVEVAGSLHILAMVYMNQGRYTEAESSEKRALAIREKGLGADHPDMMASLNTLGAVYVLQARYAEAEPLFKHSLAIRQKLLGPDHPDVAKSLNNLGVLCEEQGRYAEAEQYYNQALTIREKAFGPEHPEVGKNLSNLGVVYVDEGRFTEAEEVYRRALAIREKTLGPDHPDVAATLDNLGVLCQNLGRYAESESLHKRCLAIEEKTLGPDHPQITKCLGSLSVLYATMGRYAEAESISQRTLDIVEGSLGPNHPLTAVHARTLGGVYRLDGKYEQSLQWLRRALAIQGNAFGPKSRAEADTRDSYSFTLRAMGERDSSLSEALTAFRILQRNFSVNAPILSEKDALAYSLEVRRSADHVLACYSDLGAGRPDQRKEVCDVILQSKGLVSDGIMERGQALATETDSLTQALVSSLKTCRLQLSQLYNSGPGADTTGVYRKTLDSLGQAADNLESELSGRSASFHRRQDLNNVSIERIHSLLPERTALIEFLKWDYLQLEPDSITPRYLALVAAKGKEPKIVGLGDASKIEPLIGQYLRHMQRVAAAGRQPSVADMAEYRPISQALFDLVWKPLEQKLSRVQTVFIDPDGALNLLSLAGLADEDGRYLTEKYVIHYLSSGRDLIRLQDRSNEGTGLLAMGDPDFDASIEARTKTGEELRLLAGTDHDAEEATRSTRSGCGSLSDLKVTGLPYTRSEVTEAGRLWNGKDAASAEILLGVRATEDAFKATAPGKQVIHLATHGYYLTGECGPQIAKVHGIGADIGFVGENPLLQSGLLLAGANLHGVGCDSAHCEDGILSALEVSGLNLRGTDLVVLSACETGLGEVRAGEGVYGLRRAFQMAGVRTIISTIWPVPDWTTAEVMGRIYANSRKSLPERLRDLQLEEIKKLRNADLADHPYTWGAFISIGDWR